MGAWQDSLSSLAAWRAERYGESSTQFLDIATPGKLLHPCLRNGLQAVGHPHEPSGVQWVYPLLLLFLQYGSGAFHILECEKANFR